MLRSIRHLQRIIDRANAGAIPAADLQRARACLDLIQAEHHADLARLLLALDHERAAREAAERNTERLRRQVELWRTAAQQSWAEIEARVAQAVDRRPALRLISRRGPPSRRIGAPGTAAGANDGAGDQSDPSPFFLAQFRFVRIRTAARRHMPDASGAAHDLPPQLRRSIQ